MTNKVDKITTEMMEHICDNLCRFPREAEDEDQLVDICAECEMGRFVCDLCNLQNA